MVSTRVSIVIPTYNRVHTLDRAIQSVLAQTFQNFELFVVDDGSTDGTVDYLKGLLGKDSRLHVLHQNENRGVSSARNIGVENSSGEWLAFLDSDDEWLPEKLERQIQFAQQSPEIRLIHTEEIWIRDKVRVNASNKYAKSGGRIFKRCVDLCCIAPSSAMIRRDLFADVGLFREDFPVCEDYELWLRIAANENIGFIDESLIRKFGGHEDQLSKAVGMDLWRVRALMPFLIRDFHEDFFDSTKTPQVRDLLIGTENDFYSLISEEERSHARDNAKDRLSVLAKGALKHKNLMLQNEVTKLYQALQFDPAL